MNAEKPEEMKTLLRLIISLGIILAIVAGCKTQEGRTKGSNISKIGSSNDASAFTCSFIDPLATFCTNTCDLAQNHVADKDERVQLENSLRTQIAELTDAEQNFKINNFIKAGDVCVPGLIIKRPEDSIFVNRDYCSCLNAKRDISNNCDTFCSAKPDAQPTLYGSVSLGPSVATGESLGSLERWCNAEIGDGGVSPSCVLRVESAGGSTDIALSIGANSNRFSVNINALSIGVPYSAKIVETGSNTNFASSDSFQFMRITPISTVKKTVGPLRLMPVSQYTCLTRVGNDANGTATDTFTNAARLHFYFAANERPQNQPPGTNFLVCHDISLQENDSPLLDRLELIPQSFTLWDKADVRFRDTDGNSKADINDLVQAKLLSDHGVTQEISLFAPFQWPNAPGGGDTVPTHGYFMQAFVDPVTGKSKCPTQEDYFGSDVLFRTLKDFLGLDTEAIYTAQREPKILVDETGNVSSAPDDFILIRESTLRKVWFYFEDNLHVVPDEITINQKTLMFYYPPDLEDPYVRKASQEIYIIREASSLGSTAASGNTGGTTPDKRFGCIPATEGIVIPGSN